MKPSRESTRLNANLQKSIRSILRSLPRKKKSASTVKKTVSAMLRMIAVTKKKNVGRGLRRESTKSLLLKRRK